MSAERFTTKKNAVPQHGSKSMHYEHKMRMHSHFSQKVQQGSNELSNCQAFMTKKVIMIEHKNITITPNNAFYAC